MHISYPSPSTAQARQNAWAAGGACRAMLEAKASSRSLRSQSSLASTQSLTETVDSLQGEDETVVLSQHPTGISDRHLG